MALWSASFPESSLPWGILSFYLALAVAAASLGLVGACLFARRFSAFLAVPLVVAAMVAAAVQAGLPLNLRFAHARAGLEAAVAARGEAGPAAPCPQWVGTYRVWACDTEDSVTTFAIEGSGFLDISGFAYIPDRLPVPSGPNGTSYAPLRGPWYTYVTPF